MLCHTTAKDDHSGLSWPCTPRLTSEPPGATLSIVHGPFVRKVGLHLPRRSSETWTGSVRREGLAMMGRSTLSDPDVPIHPRGLGSLSAQLYHPELKEGVVNCRSFCRDWPPPLPPSGCQAFPTSTGDSLDPPPCPAGGAQEPMGCQNPFYRRMAPKATGRAGGGDVEKRPSAVCGAGSGDPLQSSSPK